MSRRNERRRLREQRMDNRGEDNRATGSDSPGGINRLPPQVPTENGTRMPTHEERVAACEAEIVAALERYACRVAVHEMKIDGVQQPPRCVIVCR